MRWVIPEPKVNDTRTRKVFLWLPKTLWKKEDGRATRIETRWLELATVIDVYLSNGGWCALYWDDSE